MHRGCPHPHPHHRRRRLHRCAPAWQPPPQRPQQRDLQRILTCTKENYWPGATSGQLVRAELPYWEMRKLTEGVI